MPLDNSYLQVKAQINDFLRCYLVAPKAYSEILFAVLHHFDDQISSMSEDGAKQFSQDVTTYLLDLMASGCLVTSPIHLGLYCLTDEFRKPESVNSDQDWSLQQNITRSQFFEYLEFLSQVYEVANGSFSFEVQDLEPNNSKSLDQCLAEQIQVGSIAQARGSFDLDSSAQSDVIRALVKPFSPNFITLNRGQSESKRFILGLPLLVRYNSEENRFKYIPVFYYSVNNTNFDQRSLVSLNGLVGPFINQAFLDEIDAVFLGSEGAKKDKALAVTTRESFLRNVELFLESNKGDIADFSQLAACLVEYYGECCDVTGLLCGSFNKLLSQDLIQLYKNKIVMGSILAVASSSSYKKQTSADFKAMIEAGPEALANTALRCFFADDVSHYGSKPQQQKLPVFNTFSPESKAAVVVDIDPERRCDADQSAAVRSMLKNEVTVLQGPPGTGKTMTVATAAFNHLIRGQTVLVTSFNHAAVEAFLEKASADKDWSWAKSLKSETNSYALTLDDLVKDLLNRKSIDRNTNLYNFLEPLHNFASVLKMQEQDIASNEELLKLFNQVLNQLQSSLDITVWQVVKIYLDSDGKVRFPAHITYLFKKIFGNDLNGRHPNSNFNVVFEQDESKCRKWLQWIDDLIDSLLGIMQTGMEEKVTSDLRQLWYTLSWPIAKNNNIYSVLGCERLIYLLNQVKAVYELKQEILLLAKTCKVELDQEHEDKVAEACLKNIQDLSVSTVPVSVMEHIKAIGAQRDPTVCISAIHDLHNFDSHRQISKQELDTALLYVQQHFPVTASTLLSVGKTYPLKPGIFDLVIFDEAAQFSFIDALPIMYRAKRIAIIGDPQQLKPIGGYSASAIGRLESATKLSSILKSRFNINSTLFDFVHFGCARFYGNAQSLEAKAKDYLEFVAPYALETQNVSGAVQSLSSKQTANLRYLEPMLLRQNRRSVPEIVDYISSSFYDDKLIAGREVDKQKLGVLSNIAGSNYEPGVHFVHVESQLSRDKDESGRTLIYAQEEIDLTLKMMVDVLNGGYQGTIGVIAPFRYHIDKLRLQAISHYSTALRDAVHNGQIKIDTVHRFQGLDCDLVFYNLGLEVVGTSRNRFALDPNLFNVAMSRAKDFLFVVGNFNAVLSHQHRVFIDKLRRYVSADMSDPEQQTYLAHTAQSSPAIRALTSNVKLSFDTIWEQKLYRELVELLGRDDQLSEVDYSLVTQLEYYNYRLDIALISGSVGLDVECDGSQHYKYWYSAQEYECVESDKQREAVLKAAQPLRFETIRFKNSLIDDNPRQCAEQVVNMFKSILPQA